MLQHMTEDKKNSKSGADNTGEDDWRRDHPALRNVGLENLVLADPLPMRVGESAREIVTSSSGPAMAEVTHGAVRAIVAAFDITETNWPFEVGFVVFMASAVRTLGDIDPSLDSETIAPGETLTQRLPGNARDVRVRGPHAFAQSPSPDSEGRVTFGPLTRAGIYTLDWAGDPGPRDALVNSRATRLIPVNLLDPAESAVGAREALELQTGAIVSASAGADDTRGPNRSSIELWRYLLMVAIAFLMVEWWFYNRRMAI